MEQLQEYFFEMPEVAQSFLGDIECAQSDDGAQEFEVGVGMRHAFHPRQLETSLQATDIDSGPIQRLRHVAQ